jgi:CRP-like cAMP-binding protein
LSFSSDAYQFENQLLAQLSPGDRKRLDPFIEGIDLPAKSVLCRAGERIPYVVFPANAIASTLVEMPDGDSIEVGLMGSEGMVGLDLLYGVHDSVTTVVVQVSGTGSRIRSTDFDRELPELPDFHKHLLLYSRAFMGMVAQSGACNATHMLEQRLARWLLMVHDRVRRDQFDLTQDYIALMLGVRRAGVSGAANQLRIAGAIDYSRGSIEVVNRKELERYACGCYEIIRDLSNSLYAT